MNIIIWDYESVWPKVLPQNKYRSLWPIFYVQWFCVTFWRLFFVWTSYFGIKGQYYLTFDLKINVGLCDLYFMVQWLCLLSLRLFDARVIFSDETVRPKLWPQSKYKSTWPIFHGLVILINILKIIWWVNIIVGIMDQCDLYFMVQRFSFISWRLFDGETLSLG